MKHASLAALAPLSFALVTSLALPAAAQGTMTPNAPPPAEGAAPGPSSLPPPSLPPPSPPPPVPAAPVEGTAAGGAAVAAEPTTEIPEEKTRRAPPAHRGFQVAARGGAAIPLGNAAKDSPLSDSFGAQFAAIVDIGGKIIPELFIGAYLGGNVGAVGSETSKICDARRASGCLAVTYRIGVQAQYHIIPDGKVDPWVGYGIGYEVSRIGGTENGLDFSTTSYGPEYGHILAGVDFRLTKIFGIGPFVDFSFGKFTNQTSDPQPVAGQSSDLANTALHEWLTIGAKFLFFP